VPGIVGVIDGDRRIWAGVTALAGTDTLLPRARLEGLRPGVWLVTSDGMTLIKLGFTETVRVVSSGPVMPTEFPVYIINFELENLISTHPETGEEKHTS